MFSSGFGSSGFGPSRYTSSPYDSSMKFSGIMPFGGASGFCCPQTKSQTDDVSVEPEQTQQKLILPAPQRTTSSANKINIINIIMAMMTQNDDNLRHKGGDFSMDAEYLTEKFGRYNGTIFHYQDEHYLYELRLLKDGKKISKNGNIVKLGSWHGWIGNTFQNLHLTYQEGDPCSNKFNQELLVYVTCGKKSRIVSVEDSGQCKIYMVFQTKFVCETYSEDHDNGFESEEEP
ncbi:unnamed protein product [Adineta steineri]|uniref:Glucosidase 2 subunit beta-like domain-containing protein n=1 Tax=Adineta steineri TaxID=433720 RepID=A0A819V8S8_9BILA|nr:unnamed protein product [Adineta steineri]CAF4105461.1 unnamed protein product [Adineta steineri]